MGWHLWNSSPTTFYVQKRAICLINKQPYLAHTEPLFQSSNILILEDLHKYLISIYVYKNKNSLNCFRSHPHNTRHRHNLLSTFHRIRTTQHSISHLGPTIWNSLDLVINLDLVMILPCYTLKSFSDSCSIGPNLNHGCTFPFDFVSVSGGASTVKFHFHSWSHSARFDVKRY